MNQDHLQDDQDVEQILRIAVNQTGLPGDAALRARLMSAASELGLSEEQVLHAERQWRQRKIEDQEKEQYLAEQRAGVKAHFASYFFVNLLLFAIDFLSSRSIEWAFWPLLTWGVGLGIHAVAVYFAKKNELGEEFEDWREKRRNRQKVLDSVS